jgi:hypothetical protein
MPDEQPSRTVAEEQASAEWNVLERLIDPNDQRPWSVEEIIRDRSSPLETQDAISRLQGIGLIHRTTDDLLFPTRAAVHMEQISQEQPTHRTPRRTLAGAGFSGLFRRGHYQIGPAHTLALVRRTHTAGQP